MGLETVFNEEGMSHVVIGNIVHDGQMMDTMNCHSSVESVIYRALFDIRLSNVSNHMEMNWIST